MLATLDRPSSATPRLLWDVMTENDHELDPTGATTVDPAEIDVGTETEAERQRASSATPCPSSTSSTPPRCG